MCVVLTSIDIQLAPKLTSLVFPIGTTVIIAEPNIRKWTLFCTHRRILAISWLIAIAETRDAFVSERIHAKVVKLYWSSNSNQAKVKVVNAN